MSRPDSDRRAIPSVDKVLKALSPKELPRPLVISVVRESLEAIRRKGEVPEFGSIISRIDGELRILELSRIQPIVNGTGIVVHTNLGRAPLAPEVLQSLSEIGPAYSNLEIELPTGNRGSRGRYLELCLAILCQAEHATVVNNCAAALVLVLRHFTSGARKNVIISRGELIQIGGGFRIPEILESTGARLREIGTTNRTTLEDYERAIDEKTALILKVHRSNFFMEGFVESPLTEEISLLANSQHIPLIEDLGSGALADTSEIASLEHEPTPAEVLNRGVDLVCFSGDKLMGGPQAGIIAGKQESVEALKKEPFFRALRCDKLILTALQTTAELYLKKNGEPPIPVVRILRQPVEKLRERAEGIRQGLQDLSTPTYISESESQIGGGALPRSTVESVTIDLAPTKLSLEQLASELRQGNPPVVGYITENRYRLDLRTIFENQDASLISALRSVLEICRS